ncbi:MAG: hypothetical protein ACJAWW_001306, partial [Sulfurimonas sp.]
MVLLPIYETNLFMERFMSIKIRKALSEDAPFLAQMILQSSRAEKKFGMFDLIFG